MTTRTIYGVTMAHYLDWLDTAVEKIQTGDSKEGLLWIKMVRKNLRDACLADATVEVLPAMDIQAVDVIPPIAAE